MDRENICKACDGSGLLADDEFWQYTCTICGGEGHITMGSSPQPNEPFDVDEMNRTLE